MALISAKLAKAKTKDPKNSHLNIKFDKQSMPAPNVPTKEVIKSKSTSETVFKIDRDAKLPNVTVDIL